MAKQLTFKKVSGWGGNRKGAGRPNRTGQVSHGKRPKVDLRKPLHITLRLKKGAPRLRTQQWLKEFTNSLLKAKDKGLAVLHFSLLNNHIHMIVEARNNKDLERGMKSLCGRLGKKLGGALDGRFHLRPLPTPTEVRNALAYVLLNQAKHQDLLAYVDQFSSAKFFPELRRLSRANPLLEDFTAQPFPAFLSKARSWLANLGWKKVSARPATSYA